MVERTVLDARCYVCGHLISGPVTLHTDRGRAHPSCVNCYDAPAELATLRARVEELEREVERAFRDGIAYATVCDVTDVDLAWQSSAARDRLTNIMGESDGG